MINLLLLLVDKRLVTLKFRVVIKTKRLSYRTTRCCNFLYFILLYYFPIDVYVLGDYKLYSTWTNDTLALKRFGCYHHLNKNTYSIFILKILFIVTF